MLFDTQKRMVKKIYIQFLAPKSNKNVMSIFSKSFEFTKIPKNNNNSQMVRFEKFQSRTYKRNRRKSTWFFWNSAS